jgi:hypothetical protein
MRRCWRCAREVVIRAPVPCVPAGIVWCATARGRRYACLSVREPPDWLREQLDASREYEVWLAVGSRLVAAPARLARRRGPAYYIYLLLHLLARPRAGNAGAHEEGGEGHGLRRRGCDTAVTRRGSPGDSERQLRRGS